jgi:hypothetical protein
MSVIFSDPRNNLHFFTYLATDTKGEYTYNNPDITLQTIQKAFNVLLADINGFNNSTSMADLDKYSLNILNDLQGIVTSIESCASNQTPSKCDTTICKYVGEIQLAYTFFQVILTDITNPDSKQKYDFLPFYAQNYLVKPITDNPSNIIPGGDPKNPQYSLCNSSRYQPPSDDPKMKAAYEVLIARQNEKLQSVQNNNALYNLMYVAIALLAVVIIIYIIKIMFFNGSTSTKKIGGMLRPGMPSYVRSV